MRNKLALRLEEHRRDFAESTGQPFRHFYCPLLAVDEDCEFQMGHVVNQSLEDAASDWVVQRNDIDNFYGTHFEADFEKLQHREKASKIINVLGDPGLHSKFKPTVSVGGRPIITTPVKKPSNAPFIRIGIEQDGETRVISLKMTEEEFHAALGERWTFA